MNTPTPSPVALATPSELKKLASINRRLEGLHSAYRAILPRQWEQDTLAARLNFRENASPEAVADLCTRLLAEPACYRDALSQDLTFGAANIFDREAKPILLNILKRGAQKLTEEIRDLKTREDNWKRSGEGLFTGEVQACGTRLQAEQQAAKIAECIAKRLGAGAGERYTGDFPPSVPSILSLVGLQLSEVAD